MLGFLLLQLQHMAEMQKPNQMQRLIQGRGVGGPNSGKIVVQPLHDVKLDRNPGNKRLTSNSHNELAEQETSGSRQSIHDSACEA